MVKSGFQIPANIRMAKSFRQLQTEIDRLQQRADAARKKELAGVVKEIKGVIAAWGLTAEDLGLSGARKAAPRKAVKAAKKVGGKAAARTVAYRDESGNTWGGRGPRPQWLRAALDAGRTLDEFKA
jgi:DNA-binding protein H-NS